MSKILTCVCCGSDVTMPQFHNGMVYGYTCIKKVAPAQKQVKLKFVEIEGAEIVRSRKSNVGIINVMMVVYNGKKHLVQVRESQICEQNGVTFIREDVFAK